MKWGISRVVLVAIAAVTFVAGVALAAPSVAHVSLGTVQVEWQPSGDFAGMKLRVSGPLGVVEHDFAEGENPIFDLRQLELAADGLYTWEIVATPRLDDGVRRAIAEARAAGDGDAEGRLRTSGALPDAGSMVQSGSFRVAGGAIQQPSGEAETPAAGPRRVTSSAGSGDIRRTTAADQVIPDDLIVQGSICAGFDCVNNESFGFDTIRLKENNTRIKFEDTSAGTFPTNDWQLTANDSASGGANKFSIEDITGAKVPFTLTAGATTNSIFVDSTGRVGFRTATPVLDLHVSTGNTPAIRLEQTSGSGFTAQTWDVAGNEANFFVRDVTGGSRLSFRIRPGAPTSSIDIANNGEVGIGTASPEAALHIDRSDGTAQLLVTETNGTAAQRTLVRVENNGPPAFTFANTAATGSWSFFHANNDRFVISRDGTGTQEFAVGANGDILVGGAVVHTSTRDAKEDFRAIDAQATLAKVAALPIQEWAYKRDDAHVRHLGPTAEDFHAAFQLGADDKHIALNDSIGVALAAIQGLNALVEAKDRQIEELESRLEKLERQAEQTP